MTIINLFIIVGFYQSQQKEKTMSLAKSARASEVMSKVKGGDPHVFNRRFIGYNAITEGIKAQQREADLKLQKILFNKKAKGVA